ncbi:MAG: LysR family transcriptional regulator [Azorhizobium sp. 12-66-6]|nr:MAG: LysR family transcriptional regulator [Azorhizobium sp. 12-66-6]
MDWDKLKVFHVAAEAGSFTHAGETLGLSQSAVSRQVSALEQELKVPLFHRHARGLILTEQGELLYRTAHEVFLKLESARAQLTDSREKPNGDLRVTTTVGLGTHWLTARVGEELDLAMREADVAIRMRQPVQPDLVQRKLFTVHFHAYASADYLKRHGHPRTLDELDKHRILLLGGPIPSYFQGLNWLEHAGREGGAPRVPAFEVNSVLGLKRAVERGVGIGTLPDYLSDDSTSLVQLFTDRETPQLEAYFTYAQEMRSVARIQVFRDFLISKAQRWSY